MDKQLNQLEQLLRKELAEHDALSSLLRRKHEALRRADRPAIIELCRQENALVQSIGELEKQRLMLVGQLTEQLVPGSAEPLRVTQLAQHVSEPARGRLLVLREQLRQRMEEVRQAGGVARRAAESLLRHMQGLVQMVGQAMSGAAVYSREGSAPRAALAVSTFNTTA